MTKRLKFKFNLHRVIIILFCLVLLVVLMLGASYFSLNNQAVQVKQSKELTRALVKQAAFTLAPLLDEATDSPDEQKIKAILHHLTQHSRVLDASVYKIDGTLIVQEGDNNSLKQPPTVNEQLGEISFHQQIVEMVNHQEAPVGFLRLTIDTQPSNAESKQANNTTNMLRLMLLLATVTGMILTYTLLIHQPTSWKKILDLLVSGKTTESDRFNAAKELEPIKLAKKNRPHKKKPYR